MEKHDSFASLKRDWLIRRARNQIDEYIIRINNLRWAEGKSGLIRPYRDDPDVREFVEQIYLDERRSNTIPIDFVQFFDYVTRLRPMPGDRSYASRWPGRDRSKKSSYIKQPDHRRKDPNQTDRDCWRRHKGIDRDKARCDRTNGAKTFWKRQAARDHRAWVRNRLANQQYDDMYQLEYQEFIDCFRWD